MHRGKMVPAAAIRRRDATAKTYATTLAKFFTAQERAVLGAAKGTPGIWDSDRWDNELQAMLFAVSERVAAAQGGRAAAELDGAYDESRTVAYLQKRSEVAAANINRQTREALESVTDGDPRDVFDNARAARSAVLGLSLATSVINFARKEAAYQNDASKTWVVTSSKSRHPEMDGETVRAFEPFSNGADYPGDGAALDASEVSGCQCLLGIG